MTKPVVRKLRCAVYTRKSSEEGLEQEFNSLHAQREACEAYIASQRSEGWVLIRDQYDDGGISGGTLERPGLKRLLADIEDGLSQSVFVGEHSSVLSDKTWVGVVPFAVTCPQTFHARATSTDGLSELESA